MTKKFFAVVALMFLGLTVSVVSCTNDTAEESELYIESPDHDDEPCHGCN